MPNEIGNNGSKSESGRYRWFQFAISIGKQDIHERKWHVCSNN